MSSRSSEENSCSESETKDDAESIHDDENSASDIEDSTSFDEASHLETQNKEELSDLKDKEIETFDGGKEIIEDIENDDNNEDKKDKDETDVKETSSSGLKDNEIEKVKKAHPGVFDFSSNKDDDDKMDTESTADQDEETGDDDIKISPPTARTTRSKVAEDHKKTQEILASLPCVDRLKPPNGSILSADRSETGEYASDRDSVHSGAPRLRGKKNRSDQATKNSLVRKLNTRSAKGKGRRSVMKKKAVKSLSMTPTPTTSQKIYYKGEYFSVGDIVSVTDESEGELYYGQLRGFLTDQFGDKSGVISWLLPTTGSPPPSEGFHPATYIIGPEEDIPRNMEVFTFVMHAPSDYFHNKTAPYKTTHLPPAGKDDVRMQRLGPRVIRTMDNKTVYVGIYS